MHHVVPSPLNTAITQLCGNSIFMPQLPSLKISTAWQVSLCFSFNPCLLSYCLYQIFKTFLFCTTTPSIHRSLWLPAMVADGLWDLWPENKICQALWSIRAPDIVVLHVDKASSVKNIRRVILDQSKDLSSAAFCATQWQSVVHWPNMSTTEPYISNGSRADK